MGSVMRVRKRNDDPNSPEFEGRIAKTLASLKPSSRARCRLAEFGGHRGIHEETTFALQNLIFLRCLLVGSLIPPVSGGLHFKPIPPHCFRKDGDILSETGRVQRRKTSSSANGFEYSTSIPGRQHRSLRTMFTCFKRDFRCPQACIR